ncbi:MAG TPA: hypothetical protein VF008_00870 [Niastella sp.]
MKKLIYSSILAVTLFLLGNHQASAQCGEVGQNYYCSAYSNSILDEVTGSAEWLTTISGFTISVTLEILEGSFPNGDAYAVVNFGNYRWAKEIRDGSYEGNFYAYGGPTQRISLYTTATGGNASIAAAW